MTDKVPPCQPKPAAKAGGEVVPADRLAALRWRRAFKFAFGQDCPAGDADILRYASEAFDLVPNEQRIYVLECMRRWIGGWSLI